MMMTRNKVICWATNKGVLPRWIFDYIMRRLVIEELEQEQKRFMERNSRMLATLKGKLVDLAT